MLAALVLAAIFAPQAAPQCAGAAALICNDPVLVRQQAEAS